MASVLNINTLTPSPLLPTNSKINSVEYNGNIYFITKTNIYLYDVVNNIYINKIALEYVGINSNVIVYNDKIYFYTIINSAMRLIIYDINNNTLSSEAGGALSSSDNNNYVSIFLHNDNIYRYSLTRNLIQYVGSYVYFRLSRYNITSGLSYTIYSYISRGATSDDVKMLGTRGQPIVFNNKVYYFGNYVNGLWDDYTSFIYNRNISEFDIVNETQRTLSVQFPIKLVDYGCYVKDDLIYIVGGYDLTNNTINNKIYTFNPMNNEIKELNVMLGFGLYNIDIVNVDSSYYILGGCIDLTYSYNNVSFRNDIQTLEYLEYNNTYTLSNNNGDIIYKELTNNSPITSIRFNYNEGDVGYVITTLTDVINGTYTPQIPQGYKLIGYSLTSNSNKAIFGLNETIPYNITDSTTLYEVYGKYRPLTTSFKMTLYRNSAEFNRVDKTDYLEIVGDVSGVLREETDIINPSINIETPFIDFNYVYIETFNRYYYVKNITSIRTNIWRVGLAVDVLMSYKDLIKQQKALIGRQENYYNKYLIDTEIICESNKDYTFVEIPNDILNTEESQQPCFIATILGAIPIETSTTNEESE